MPNYTDASQVPQYVPVPPGFQGSRGSVPGGQLVQFRGGYFDPRDFQARYPDAYNDLQRATGGNPTNPAGSVGSPYPTALPASSFEAAVDDSKRALSDANADNQKRYTQLLGNSQRKLNLIDSSFAGINSATSANAEATSKDLGGVYDTMQSRLGTLQGGYADAAAQVDQAGQSASEQVHRNQQSADAVGSSSLRQRGLYNSTVTDAMTRRNTETANRGYAQIAEGVGQLKSGIAERGTQAMAGAQGDLGNFQMQAAGINQANRQQGIGNQQNYLNSFYQGLSDRANVIYQKQTNAPSPFQIAQLVGNHEVGQATANAAENAGVLGLAGSALGGLGSLGGGLAAAGLLSDKDAKTDKKRVGSAKVPGSKKGAAKGGRVPVYSYKYKDAVVAAGKAPGGRHVGPMAQDVKKVKPGAVKKGKDGYLRIVDRAAAGMVK